MDARRALPSDDDRYIILRRPHTVLLLSSIRGGHARRGAYTDAIAEQFMIANGETDLHEMHCRAATAIQRRYPDDHQVPELRSSLTKRFLIGYTGKIA